MRQNGEPIDCRGKVSICLSCKTVRVSETRSQECEDCGHYPKAVWENKSDFIGFVKKNGLKEVSVDDKILEILTDAGLVNN